MSKQLPLTPDMSAMSDYIAAKPRKITLTLDQLKELSASHFLFLAFVKAMELSPEAGPLVLMSTARMLLNQADLFNDGLSVPVSQ